MAFYPVTCLLYSCHQWTLLFLDLSPLCFSVLYHIKKKMDVFLQQGKCKDYHVFNIYIIDRFLCLNVPWSFWVSVVQRHISLQKVSLPFWQLVLSFNWLLMPIWLFVPFYQQSVHLPNSRQNATQVPLLNSVYLQNE